MRFNLEVTKKMLELQNLLKKAGATVELKARFDFKYSVDHYDWKM